MTIVFPNDFITTTPLPHKLMIVRFSNGNKTVIKVPVYIQRTYLTQCLEQIFKSKPTIPYWR